MSDDPKHMKIKTFTPQPDGSMMIETDSYHEKRSGYKQEFTKKIQTSTATILSDIVSCLDVLKGKGTPELIIVIRSDEHNLPTLIEKTWTTDKETFKRR